MITEDYISFETAKLLKEKGFDEATFHDFDENGIWWFEEVLVNHNSQGGIACPTLQMVMKWLRDVHNIFIGIFVCERYENLMDADTKIMFFFELFSLKEKQTIDVPYQYYVRTYEEACEAAIKYCLENLI